MPFQSEKQRRYLWANEPEIARDWTDTYGSGIARALGGRIQYQRGGPGPGGQGARGQATQNPGRSGPSGPPGGGDRQMTYTAPAPKTTHTDRITDVAKRKQRQDVRDLLARQQAEKDYTRTGQIKPGPQLGWAGSGRGGGLGNWASQFAGSKIGGGLGSMLFGPWGMLLGSLFGRGVGKRGYQAYQTKDKKESLKNILLGENNILSSMFNKRINEQPRGEGIETIDIRDKFDRRGDDPYSSISETINDYDYKPRYQADDTFATAKKGMTNPYRNPRGTARFPYDEEMDYRSDLEKMAEASGVRSRIEPEDTDYRTDLYREGRNRNQYTFLPEVWKKLYGSQ